MGINLIREVYDHAPADLTPAEMNLLVAVAWTARDSTREAVLRDGQEQLMLLARMKRKQLKAAYTSLDARGIQLRVPMRHADGSVRYRKDGSPLYAARGHVTVLRVPSLITVEPVDNSPVDNPQRGPDPDPFPPRKGSRSGQKGVPIRPERGPDSGPPRKSWEVKGSQISARGPGDLAAVIEAVHNRTGKTIDLDHANRVVEQVVAGHPEVRKPIAYAAAVIRNDDNPRRFLPATGQSHRLCVVCGGPAVARNRCKDCAKEQP